MTKAQLIKKIQYKEAEAHLELKKSERRYGREDSTTRNKLGAWFSLISLMDELNIMPDYNTPMQDEILEYIMSDHKI